MPPTIRELRNHGGDVVDRVEAGEHMTVQRASLGATAVELSSRDFANSRLTRLTVAAPATRAEILDAGDRLLRSYHHHLERCETDYMVSDRTGEQA